MRFKRTLALLLAMVMVLSLCPTTAFAAETEDGDWEYTVNDDNTVTIDACNDDDSYEIVVPETLEGYPVTEIGIAAFAGMELASITLPGTLTAIASKAFRGTTVDSVYFTGTQAQWDALMENTGTDNTALTNAELHITYAEPLALDTPVELDLGAGESLRFCYTSAQSGWYLLTLPCCSYNGTLWTLTPEIEVLSDGSYAHSHFDGDNDNYYAFYYIPAGVKATFTIGNYESYEATSSVTVSMVETMAINGSADLTLEAYTGTYFAADISAEDTYLLYTDTPGIYSSSRPTATIAACTHGYSQTGSHYSGSKEYRYATLEAGSSVLIEVHNYHWDTHSTYFSFMEVPEPNSVRLNVASGVYRDLVGQINTVRAIYDPEYAKSELTWTIEDESVAKISYQYDDYVEVEFLSAGTTAITVTTENGLSATGTLIAVAPTEMALGETYDTTVTGTANHEYFDFTAPEDGYYTFTLSGAYADGYYLAYQYADSSWNGSYWDVRDLTEEETGRSYRIYYMDAGTTLRVGVRSTRSDPVQTSLCVSYADTVTELKGTEEIIGMEGSFGYADVTLYPFSAWGDVEWSVADESVAAIYDSDNGSCRLSLLSGGTTTLTAKCGDAVLEIPVTVEAPTELEVGVPSEEVTLGEYEEAYYTFTAPETGRYTFYLPYCESGDGWYSLYTRFSGTFTSLRNHSDESGYWRTVAMEAGEQLDITVYHSWSRELTTSLSVDRTGTYESLQANYTAIEGMPSGEVYVSVSGLPYGAYEELTWAIEDEAVASFQTTGSGYRWIDLNAVGTTTLTVTGESGVSIQIPITVTVPTVLELGTPVDFTVNVDQRRYFSFTAPQSGDYYFFTPNVSDGDSGWNAGMSIFNSDGTYNVRTWTGNDLGYYCYLYMEEGTRIVMELQDSNGYTGSHQLGVYPTPVAQALTPDREAVEGLPDTYTSINISTAPQEALLYDVQFTIADPSVAEISYSGRNYCSIRLISDGETTLTITNYDGASVTVPITVSSGTALTLNEPAYTTLEGSTGEYFSFTAPTAGYYRFFTPRVTYPGGGATCNINQYNSQGDFTQIIGFSDGGNGFLYWLDEGTRLTLELWNGYSDLTLSTSLTVTEAPAPTELTLDEEAIYGLAGSSGYGVFASFSPSGSWSHITWTVEDESVAKISSDYRRYIYLSFEAVGHTTLTATAENGLSVTVPITVVEPTPIALDETLSFTAPRYQHNYFSFTADETCVYGVKTPVVYTEDQGWDSLYIDWHSCDGSIEYIAEYETDAYRYRFYRIDQGSNVVWDLRNPYPYTMESSVCVYKAEAATSIGFRVETLEGYPDTYPDVSFFPLPEGSYVTEYPRVTVSGEDIASLNWTNTWSVGLYLRAEGQTALTVTCGDIESTLPVKVLPPPALELDKAEHITLANSESITYTFTAPYSGYFTLTHSATYIPEWDGYGTFSMDVSFGEGDYSNIRSWDSDYTDHRIYYLAEGTQMRVYLQSHLPGTQTTTLAIFPTAAPTDIEVNQDSISGEPGAERYFSFEILPYNSWDDVTCTVEDPSVATVRMEGATWGYVKLIGEGETTLTISCGQASATILVRCKAPVILSAEGQADFTAEGGDSQDLTFTFPETGYYIFTFTGSHGNYYVDSHGLSQGEGYEWGGSEWPSSELYLLYIKANAGSVLRLRLVSHEPGSYTATAVKALAPTELTLDRDTLTDYVGAGTWVYASFQSEAAFGQVEWSIADETVARINGRDSSGVYVSFQKPGSTTLTAKCGELSVTIPVTVLEPATLESGAAYSATLAPDAYFLATFTAPADGIYAFYSPNTEQADGGTARFYISENGYEGNVSHIASFYRSEGFVRYYEMAAGATVRLRVRNDYADRTVSSSITACPAPGIQSVSFSMPELSGIVGGQQGLRYSTGPWYAWGELTWSVEDPSIASIVSVEDIWVYVDLLNSGSTTLTASCGELSWSIPVTVQAPLTLTVDQPLSLEVTEYTPVTLRFVFPETGMYAFTASSESEWFDFYDADYTGEGYIWGGGSWVYGGYRMFIGGNKGDSVNLLLHPQCSETVTFTAVKATEPETLQFTTNALSGSTGGYCSTRLEMTPGDAWASVEFTVADESVARVEHGNGTSVTLMCLKAGTTTLTAKYGELSVSIPVTVKDPLILNAGEPVTLTVAPGQRETIKFTYPERALYVFRAAGSQSDFSFWDDDWDADGYGWSGGVWNADDTQYTMYITLDQGGTLTMVLENDAKTATTFTLSALKATEPTGLALSSTEIVEEMERHVELFAEFLPASGYGQITWEIADPSVARIEYTENVYASIYLAAPGSTTLTASCGDASVTIPITVKPPLSFQLDQTTDVTVKRGENLRLLFTAPESGIYAFRIPHMQTENGSYSLYPNLSGSMNGTASQLEVRSLETCYVLFVEMTKGTQAIIYLNNWNDMDVTTAAETVLATAPTALTSHTKEIKGVPGTYGSASVSFAPDTAWGETTWTVADETVAVIDYSARTNCSLTLKKVGTTTLTATSGEASVSIPVTVEPPTELTLDVPVSATLGEDAEYRRYYSFTAPETGIYGFKTPCVSVFHAEYGRYYTSAHIYLFGDPKGAEELGSLRTDDHGICYVRMEKGATALLAMTWDIFGTVDTSITAFKTVTPTALYLDHSAMTLSPDNWFELYASFGPENGYGELVWSVEGDAVELDTHYDNINVGFRTVKPGTAVITVQCGDVSTSCTVYVREPETIGMNDTAETGLNPGTVALYSFTAPESGVYVFRTHYTAGSLFQEFPVLFYVDSSTGYCEEILVTYSENCCYSFFYLEAGAAMTFGLENTSDQSVTVDVMVLEPDTPKAITAIPGKLSGAPGESTHLNVAFDSPLAYSELTWAVADDDIVTLHYLSADCMEVIFLADGETTITVTTESGLKVEIPVSVSGFRIIQQPLDIFAIEGNTAAFRAEASGKGLTYRWYYRTSSTGTWKFATGTGYNTDTLTVTATAKMNGYQYFCRVTDANGERLDTDIATLTVGIKIPVTGGGNYGSGYVSLSASLNNAENGYVVMPGNMTEDITVTKDAYLDLNGHILMGDVTIAEGATLYVFDSATADYTAENCGGIIGTVTGDLARSFNTPAAYGHNYKYLALEIEENVWTFHRYYLSVKSVILAPCMEGSNYTGTAVNYKTVFKCNELVAEYVTAYGTKLTGDQTVYADALGRLKAGAENVRVTSLGGTMKTTNTPEQNLANALLAPTACAYITLADGTELCSAGVTRSLQDVAEYANALEDLSLAQELALGKMYDLFKPVMDTWSVDIRNIQAYGYTYFGTELPPAFAIAEQPEAVTAAAGEKAVFAITATGKVNSYRWYYRTSSTGSWKFATGDGYNTDTLTVTATAKMNGYEYFCRVTNVFGEKLDSEPATLTVQ